MFGAIFRSDLRSDRDQRGFATSVQWALLVPLLLGVVIGACDAATYLHARTATRQAAVTAATAAAVWDATAHAGHDAVGELMRPTAVTDLDLTVAPGPRDVVATVDSTVRLVTGERTLSATAVVPRERLT